MLVLGFAVIAGVAFLAYERYMGFATVSYEIRHCQEPLTAGSDWAAVRSAACDPAPAATAVLVVHENGDERTPDETSGSTYSFDGVPVNSPAPGIRVRLDQPAQSVVVADPESETVRRALTSDAPALRWSGNIGGRGPVHYWVLVSP